MRPFLAVSSHRLAGRLILANGRKSRVLTSSLARMASSNSDGGYRIEADTFGTWERAFNVSLV